MKVRVKLYALLQRYLPAGGDERNETDLEVADGTTVAQVFRQLNLPSEYCHLVLVNGAFVPPGERETRALAKGDHLAVWPPVAGGAVVEGKPPPAAPKKTLVAKEMAVTHADFFRILPKALGTEAFKKTGKGAVLEDAGRRLEIGLGPERTRRIAGLAVPATEVTLAFAGYDRADIAAAVTRFERAFQKGGG